MSMRHKDTDWKENGREIDFDVEREDFAVGLDRAGIITVLSSGIFELDLLNLNITLRFSFYRINIFKLNYIYIC